VIPHSKRRPVALLTFFAGLLAAVAVAIAPAAHADGAVIKGSVLDPEGGPIAGVTFTVANADGFSESTQSDEEGKWSVDVPERGTYTVDIDTGTLPEGVTLTDPEKTSLTVTLLSNSKTVVFPTGEGSAGGESTMDRLLQLTVDGLVFGLVIALAGIGLSMIFGTTGLTNFSHGELVTFGAISTLILNNFFELPFVLAAAAAMLLTALFGAFQDKILWLPLRKKGISLIAMLVVSIGLGIFLRYVYLFFLGGSTQQFREYSGQAGIAIGPVDITPKIIVATVIAIAAITAVLLWLGYSRIGKASRAISDNPALASASGINVERVINVVWAVGAGLAGLSGVLYAMNIGVTWLMGFQILLLVFASVILGGLGTAAGALVGALIVGVLIQVSTLVIPTELKNVGALFIMIVILLFRPQGLLGRSERVG
jgi:neutral amino acid transport system permease protein